MSATERALAVLERLDIETDVEFFTSSGLFSTSVELNEKYGVDLAVLSLAREFNEAFQLFDVNIVFGEEDRTLNIYLEICNVTIFNIFLVFGESEGLEAPIPSGEELDVISSQPEGEGFVGVN